MKSAAVSAAVRVLGFTGLLGWASADAEPRWLFETSDLLRDGATELEPYAMRASEARVQSVASCTYRGRLFAIGSSWAELGKRFFRATPMDVPEYPGDIPCDKDEPTPAPEPVPGPVPGPTPQPSPAPRTNPASVLPKTSDPTVLPSVMVGIGVCGVAALVAGFVLRKRDPRE